MSKSIEQKAFLSDLLNPSKWIQKGNGLLNVADHIYPKVQDHCFMDSFFMICSFALENYFKAIIVSKNPEEIKSETEANFRLPRRLDEHDLLRLSRVAEVEELFDDEQLST